MADREAKDQDKPVGQNVNIKVPGGSVKGIIIGLIIGLVLGAGGGCFFRELQSAG